MSADNNDFDSAVPPTPDLQGNQAMNDLDVLKRDRFELLSAYLDGEVTVQERKQVEAWLASDPEMQRLHSRLLKLNRSFQSLPVPAEQPVEQTITQVMDRLNRRPKLLLVWSGLGAAAAAAFVGAVSGILPGGSLIPQLSQTAPASIQASPLQAPPAVATRSSGDDGLTLMLALDRPPVAIPKVATSPTQQSQ